MLPIQTRKPLASAIAFAAIALSGTAAAEDGEVEQAKVSTAAWTTPIIVSATGADVHTDETGLAVTLLTQADIERSQAASIADLVAATPGVSLSRNGPIGGVTAVRIRGAEGDQTLVLIDGVRVNDPSAPGGGFDFGNLMVGTIDRVEVLRGANAVPWGSQALGGIVNVSTAGIQRGTGGVARAEYGANDRFNLAGHYGARLGAVAASLGGGYFREDGISAFKDGNERDGYRQYAANGRVAIDLSDDVGIDLRAYYADSRADIDGFPPPFFGFADTAEWSTNEQLTAYAGINAALAEGQFRNRLSFTLSDINRDNFSVPGQVAPDFLSRGRTERFEYQGDWRIGETVRAVFGAEQEHSRISDGFSRSATRITSGYAQLIARPTSAMTLTGGVRHDDHRDYGGNTTLSGNAVWELDNGLTLRAAYAEGYKSPTLFQLNSFFGNIQLQPERARSYEAGVAWSGGPYFSASATLYRRDTRNQIDFISCFGQSTGICTGRPFGTYDNIDRTKAQGIELEVRISPVSEVAITANYTLTDTADKASGLSLLRRPRHRINLDGDWTVARWLRLGAALQLSSDSADVDFQTFARTRLDGYVLASVRAAVPIGRRFELFGRAENLGNVRYETVSGYGSYGRTAHMGVRARF